MTILGLEQPVGYSHISTFDPTTAQMVLAAQNNYINALRDEYKQGLADIKEFGKEYGDFISPIEEDMRNYYNATTGAMNKLFSEAQARGIDLLRSPEGRSLVQQFIAARPYGQMAQWKQNAENAKTFLRVAASRKTQNPEFDRWWWNANYGIDDLSQWGQSNQTRGKVFDVSSIPTFQTLQDLTADTVSSLQPGVLNQQQVHSINPQLKYDPRYTYTGRSQDMIEGVLQDYMPGLASDPNYQFHLERARQKAAYNKRMAGDNTRVTDQDAYNQLMNDAVDANRRFIGGLKYNADQFALSDHQYRQQVALKKMDQDFQRNMQQAKEAADLNKLLVRYGFKTQPGKQNVGKGYSLTEQIHHDMLYSVLKNNGIPVPQLERDKNGNVVAQRDKSGKVVYKNIDNATWEELEYAAKHNNSYIFAAQNYVQNITNKYLQKHDESGKALNRLVNSFKNRFGTKLSTQQVAAFYDRALNKDGSIQVSIDEIQNMRSSKDMIAGAVGSKLGFDFKRNKGYVYGNNYSSGSTATFKLDESDTKNAVQIMEKYNGGRTEVYVKGSLKITTPTSEMNGKKVNTYVQKDVWLPLGLNSENWAQAKGKTIPNFSLNGSNQGYYQSIDARFLKSLGSQKNANVGLFSNVLDDDDEDEDINSLTTSKKLIELLENNR